MTRRPLWISPHLRAGRLQLLPRAVGSQAVALYVQPNARYRSGCGQRSRTRDSARIDVVPWNQRRAAAASLACLESALAAGSAGRPCAMPTGSNFQPLVFERGVVGRPTLVHTWIRYAHRPIALGRSLVPARGHAGRIRVSNAVHSLARTLTGAVW